MTSSSSSQAHLTGWTLEEDNIKLRIPGVCSCIKKREKLDSILDAHNPIDTVAAKESNDRKRAQFRLIAAAPDLLEACKALKHDMQVRNLQGQLHPSFWNGLVDAIAKAEGKA